MTTDRAAAFEAGVQDCHGAPARGCCIESGLDRVDKLTAAGPGSATRAHGWAAMLQHGAPEAGPVLGERRVQYGTRDLATGGTVWLSPGAVPKNANVARIVSCGPQWLPVHGSERDLDLTSGP